MLIKKLSTYKLMFKSEVFHTISLLFKSIIDARETRYHISPAVLISVYRARRMLSIPDHKAIQEIALNLTQHNHNIGFYYSAISHFLNGKFTEAHTQILKFIAESPCNADGQYLLAEILISRGRRDEARIRLQQFSKKSNRFKTWMMLANLVTSRSDLENFLENLTQSIQLKLTKATEQALTRCISNACLRAQDFENMRRLWRNRYKEHIKSGLPKARKPIFQIKRFSCDMGSKALLDIDDILTKANIQFFLISGTLLGCIREDRLLGHDQDLDIGVWLDDGMDRISKTLSTSGLFYVVPVRSKELLKLRHVNGTDVDIFFHRKEPDKYTHSGVKLVWHNEPFSLKSHNFLGRIFLIPSDPEKYLTENYGAWRVPRYSFDCAIDTPNGIIYDFEEMYAYAYSQLIYGGERHDEYKKILLMLGEKLSTDVQ